MKKIIGIDLGTTNSAVSVYEMGISHTIQLAGSMTTPSIIWVNPQGDYVVGREAKQHVAADPDHILISTKRDLGSPKVYQIGTESFTPTDAATIILAYLKKEAQKVFSNDEVNDVVITVPAYFGTQEIGEVKKAAIDAGLNPLAIIPEPTAAAIRYGLDSNRSRQTICVIDLGGGTFDVTVLDVRFNQRNNTHDISPVKWDGDHYLGGDDFDNCIIEWMIQNGAKDFKSELELKATAEAAKIELASLSATQVSHPKYMPNAVVLTRDKYKALIQDKLNQIGETIRKTVKNSVIDGEHLDMDAINRFVLVGGSCKHPIVKDFVKDIIGKEPFSAPNLDCFVADGAAIYHHVRKTPGCNINIETKLPHSLGTDLLVEGEKINAIILEQGTVVPCRAVQLAQMDANAPQIRSYVIEGEEHLFENNKQLELLEDDLTYTGYAHPVITEFILDDSSNLSFNTYILNLTDDNIGILEDDLNSLWNSARGDAHLIDNTDWDRFYSKYASYIDKKHKELTLNTKPE